MITPEEIKRIKIEICLGTFDPRDINSTLLKDLDDSREFNLICCMAREYWRHLILCQRFEVAQDVRDLHDKIIGLGVKELEEKEGDIACGSTIQRAEENCAEFSNL